MKRSNAKVTGVPTNMVVTCMRLVVLCGIVNDRDGVKTEHPAQVETAVAAARSKMAQALQGLAARNWVNKDAFSVFALADIGLPITKHGPFLFLDCLYRSVLWAPIQPIV
jgi:hypothetical protein